MSASNPIDNKTKIPEGVLSKIYEIMISATTKKIEKIIDIIAIDLKPFPYIITVTFRITKR